MTYDLNITFDDNLITGNKTIDTQHKELIERIQNFVTAYQIVVYKVDTDKQKELSAVMGIQSLPTIIFIPKTGQPQIIIGAANKATFRKAIEEVLLKE